MGIVSGSRLIGRPSTVALSLVSHLSKPLVGYSQRVGECANVDVIRAAVVMLSAVGGHLCFYPMSSYSEPVVSWKGFPPLVLLNKTQRSVVSVWFVRHSLYYWLAR